MNSFYALMLSIGVTFDNDEDLDGADKARKSDMENQNDNPQILEEKLEHFGGLQPIFLVPVVFIGRLVLYCN